MLTLNDIPLSAPLEDISRCECGNCGAWDQFIKATSWGICGLDIEKVGRVPAYRYSRSYHERATCPEWRPVPVLDWSTSNERTLLPRC